MKLVQTTPASHWIQLDPPDAPVIAARPDRMGEVNSRELLRLLRKHSPCSRADLVRLSGLAAPTVSLAIKSLQQRGLVSFIGAGSSNGGRPPRLLQFRADAGFVCGADISFSNARLTLADLNGHILGRWNSNLSRRRTPNDVVDQLADGIEQLTRQHRVPPNKCLGVVVGVPGVTNIETGRVISAPSFPKWSKVPLRSMLERRVRMAVCVENDVNLSALGECWRGNARGVRDFVFIAIRSGVGAGIVVNGNLIHGSDWSAGEIGHLLVPGLPSANSINVNVLGKVEQAIGSRGLEKAWSEGSKGSGRKTHLRASEIFDRAAQGDDEDASQLLSHSAEILAASITNISLILNTSLAVLGGEVGMHPALLKRTRELLERQQFARPKLASSKLGDDAQLCGAIWLALQIAEANGYRETVAAP